MKLRCAYHMCNKVIDFRKGHVSIHDHVFCSATCMEGWRKQNDLFSFAVKGEPLLGRRPTRERQWHEKDG